MNACWVPQLHAAPQHIPQVPRRREGGVCGPKVARLEAFCHFQVTSFAQSQERLEAAEQKYTVRREGRSRTWEGLH